VPARAVRAVLAALLVMGALSTLPTATTPAAATDASTCPVTEVGGVGTWTRRPAPITPSGRNEITAHAVHPADPTRHLVTDGISILRTEDDGCSWDVAFSIPSDATLEMPIDTGTSRILDLVVHPASPTRAWAVVGVGHTLNEDGRYWVPLSPNSRNRRDVNLTVLLRSDDGGRSWRAMQQPTPIPGGPTRLAPAPSEPDVVYLVANGQLWASADGGDTWLLRPTTLLSPDMQPPPPYESTPIPHDLAVDPLDAQVLFSRTVVYAHRSDDGGVTWTLLPPAINSEPAGPIIDRFGRDEHGPRVLYVHQRLNNSFPRAFMRHRPEVGDLQELVVPEGQLVRGAPLDWAWHPVRDEVLLATWQNNISRDTFDIVSFYLVDLSVPRTGDQPAVFTDIDELGLSPVRGVDVDRTGTYHLHTRDELVSLRVAADGLVPPDVGARDPNAARCDGVGDVPELQPADATTPEPASLQAPGSVALQPDQRRSATVTLDLPASPGALDVYLLLDTSNGFSSDIGDVGRSMAEVVRALADVGVDVHAGLGGLGTADTYRYRRVVDISPPGERLRQGLAGLCTNGSYESHLVSLHQTATGAGLPAGGPRRPAVPAGQDPTWRPDSLRTVILVTDNEFDDRTVKENDPDAPPREEVFAALAERNIHVIGIEVVRDVVTPLPSEGQEATPGWLAVVEAADRAGTTAPTPVRQDMEALARATRTFAPPGGVDCRGTGRAELSEGDPLVCTTFSTSALDPVAGQSTMGEVLQRVLLAQQDPRTIRLTADAPAGFTAYVVPDGGHLDVDVRRDHRGDDALPFEVVVSCDAEAVGRTATVDLRALIGDRPVASQHLTLTCAVATSSGPPDGGSDGADESSSQGGLLPPPGGTPGTIPVSGQAPVPVSAPGTSPAAGQAAAPSVTPGTAPSVLPGTAGATGTASAASSTAVPGLALAPDVTSRPRAAVVGATLHASARPDTPPVGLAGWLAIAATGSAASLMLGSRRPSITPATIPHRDAP
jgi:hypothetical protein